MQCPRCAVKLSACEAESDAFCCPKCAGILIKQRQLNGILQRLYSKAFKELNMNSVPKAIVDKGPIGSCPSCHSKMDYYGYMESNKVLIDYCDRCNCMWLDPLELLAIVDMYAMSKHHGDYLKSTAYEGADLMTPYANGQEAMKAFVWSALGSIG